MDSSQGGGEELNITLSKFDYCCDVHLELNKYISYKHRGALNAPIKEVNMFLLQLKSLRLSVRRNWAASSISGSVDSGGIYRRGQ